MCRSIKPLFNFDPPATDQEIEAAALQFVRKLSGFNKPSEINQKSFDLAVEKISQDAKLLLQSLKTNAKPKDREKEAEKRKKRFLPN